MRRLVLVLTSAAAAALCLATSTDAKAAGRDAASARVYVRAAHVLVGDLIENVAAGHVAVDALIARVRAQCPDALSGAPDEDNGAISSELTDLVLFELIRPDFPAVREFLHRTSPLHWASRTIEAHVRRQASGLKAELAVKPPAICSDLQLWAGSGFKVIPPGAVAFVHSFQRAEARDTEGMIELLDLISAHEGRGLQGAVRSIHGEVDRFAGAFLRGYLDEVAELSKAVGAPHALSESAGL